MQGKGKKIKVARLGVVAATLLLLSACGTAQHAVKLNDPAAFSATTRVAVGEVRNATGQVYDVDIERLLRDAVTLELRNAGLHAEGQGGELLLMALAITEYQKGDAFKRWLMPGYGSTVLAVRGELRDAQGNLDAQADARRTVDAGGAYTIGAWESIFNQVAKDLVGELRKQRPPG